MRTEKQRKIKKHDTLLIIPLLVVCYFIIYVVLSNKELQLVFITMCKINCEKMCERDIRKSIKKYICNFQGLAKINQYRQIVQLYIITDHISNNIPEVVVR